MKVEAKPEVKAEAANAADAADDDDDATDVDEAPRGEAGGSEGGGDGRGRRRRRQRRRRRRRRPPPPPPSLLDASNNERRAADAAAAAAAAAAAGARAEATRLYARNDPAEFENEQRRRRLHGRAGYRAIDGGRLASQMDNCIAPKDAAVEGRRASDAAQEPRTRAPPRQRRAWDRVGFKPARRIGFGQLLEDYPAEGGDTAMPYLPEVKFLTSDDGRTGPTVLIDPDEWSLESGRDKVAWRKQLPLKLAWAISIHKSQGMTLEAAELDLASCFEPGHAYVALSRVVSLAATRLLSFDPSRVYAHPKVVAYYERLDGGGRAARRRRTRARRRRERRRRRRTLGGAASADRGEQGGGAGAAAAGARAAEPRPGALSGEE